MVGEVIEWLYLGRCLIQRVVRKGGGDGVGESLLQKMKEQKQFFLQPNYVRLRLFQSLL